MKKKTRQSGTLLVETCAAPTLEDKEHAKMDTHAIKFLEMVGCRIRQCVALVKGMFTTGCPQGKVHVVE